jgi:hypothetical protein
MSAVPAGPASRYPRSIVRAWVAIVAAVLVAASAGFAKEPAPNVRGTLTRGPVLPVCVPEKPCYSPLPGVVLVFSRSGQEVKRVTTGVAGRFAMRLPPGTYGVRTLKRQLIGSGLTPTRFRVPTAGAVVLRLHLDSGIR